MVKPMNVTISQDNNNYNSKTDKVMYSNLEEAVQSSLTGSSTVCSICKSNQKTITDPDSGEIICSNCGVVISDKTEQTGAEWLNYASSSDGSNDRSRIGMPTSLARHDMGLSTVIGMTDKDASGQKIDAAMRSTMERLRISNLRTQTRSSTDRSLLQAFNQLDRLKDKLGLSDPIVEKSAYIYRKAQEKMLIRGRTVSGILSAAIYIACREFGTPRTLKDISQGSNVKLKEVARSYRLLYFELDLKMPLLDPMKCIVKVANKVKLSEKTKRQAAGIMSIATKKELSTGKDPMGLAASVLYLASRKNDEKVTQADIASAAGVTEVTVRNSAKDLRKRVFFN
jgi:transcription initiation factor TFIIB